MKRREIEITSPYSANICHGNYFGNFFVYAKKKNIEVKYIKEEEIE